MTRLSLFVFLWLTLFLPAFAVDREAFAITRYQLEVQVDRTAHVMAVTGKLTLRNDSNKPQKLVTLQVSSSLAWNGIALDGKLLQWLGDNYTSDINHTGSLSEAIVTLPKDVPPATTVTLDVQYGGAVTQDATRLTRTGVPADVATRNDWDEISESFTAVRGLGYVVWYPVAIEAVSLSDGNAVFDAIARWKYRHDRSEFAANLVVTEPASLAPLCIAVNAPGSSCGDSHELTENETSGKIREYSNALHVDGLSEIVPTFAIANYVELARPTITLLHLPDHTSLARDYALAAEANDPLLHEWLPEPAGAPPSSPQARGWNPSQARVVELTDPNANPWQNGAVLFTPLREAQTSTLQLLLLPAQVATRFHSPHAWIQDGLERFLQVATVENRSGRRAALEYLDQYREPLAQAEEQAHPKLGAATRPSDSNAADNTLLNTNDELYLRGKSGFVFWMLRDMVGNEAMQQSIAAYRSSADKDPSYFQRLLQANSKHDLEWFFDDWVYRDRGLPDFHVESVYPRPLLSEKEKNYMVTATIENRGHAGAEVPVIIQTPSGEKSVRVLVKAGEKGVGRIAVPVVPSKIVVNDGSVPEANMGNKVYEIPPPQQ
ncbi:MAG TPA: hypothetical protein VKG65_01370 [Terriglobales bacterium]|nr:hypothetical protein [Terriglobales bacterium]